jgi:hypothetical protein
VSDSAETSKHQANAGEVQSTPAAARAPWPPSPSPQESAASTNDHPELIIGAAFAGGLLAATILKRLAR